MEKLFFEYSARADYVADDELLEKTAISDYYSEVLRKLLDKTPRLLIGPRGTGKTHQMRLAHLQALKSQNMPFTIFVSFNRYIYLEPLLRKTSLARQIFHTWSLILIAYSVEQALIDGGVSIDDDFVGNYFKCDSRDIEKFFALAEKGQAINNEDVISSFNLSSVKDFITHAMNLVKRRRCVVLMDDTAISLSEEYFEEFLDIFQGLKSRLITPKASVYPGTRYYGSRFSLKHDAEPIPIWMSIEDPSFLSIMRQIAEKQLGLGIQHYDIIDYFAYCSFGVPRSFLSMLSSYMGEQNGSTQSKINKIVEQQVKLISDEIGSVQKKYPQYLTMLAAMEKAIKSIAGEIVMENKKLIPVGTKQIRFGITNDKDFRENRVKVLFDILREAGLIYEDQLVKHGTFSDGESREYQRFIPHMALLIQGGAFRTGKGFNIANELLHLRYRNAKHPHRRTLQNLVSIEELSLDLPKCQNCGEARINQSQKFCHNCGARLIDRSAFEMYMQQSIDVLPLTDWQKRQIKENTSFRQISDFIYSNDPKSELRQIRHIGKQRSHDIVEKVRAYISEVLA